MNNFSSILHMRRKIIKELLNKLGIKAEVGMRDDNFSSNSGIYIQQREHNGLYLQTTTNLIHMVLHLQLTQLNQF